MASRTRSHRSLFLFLTCVLLGVAPAITLDLRFPVTVKRPEPAVPPVPVWPAFTVDFSEQTKIIFRIASAGRMYYDGLGHAQRVNRDSGLGDRYCGTAAPFSHAPCDQFVANGMRYLHFPASHGCCRCCSAADGCGALRPDWLNGADYLGNEVIQPWNISADRWQKQGIQANTYWEATEGASKGIPLRLLQVPNDDMTFDAPTYRKGPPRSGALDLPAACSRADVPRCSGICRIADTSGSPSVVDHLLAWAYWWAKS